jgi:Flp pilus assembly protein TadD
MSMRCASLLIVLLLAACAGSPAGGLADRPPGLAVARAALANGAPEMALQICADVEKRRPQDVEAVVCEGNALAALGRRDEAAAAFGRAQQLAPDATEVLMGLGRLRLATDAVAAETLFRRVVARDPGNAAAWNDLGIACDLQGRHEEAQRDYGKALGLQPGMRGAEVNLALSMAMSGQADEAVRRLRALAADPAASPRLRQDLAAALAMANRPREAAKLLEGDLTPEQATQAIAGWRALSSPAAR